MSPATARAAALPAPRRPAVGAPRPAPARATPAPPRLRPVPAPPPVRSRVPFVLLCMAVLASALLGALLLNTAMATGAYEAARLQAEIARLSEREQDLAAALERHGSPDNLARAARELGMVPAPELAFLRLSDGAVLGDPTPAKGGGGG